MKYGNLTTKRGGNELAAQRLVLPGSYSGDIVAPMFSFFSGNTRRIYEFFAIPFYNARLMTRLLRQLVCCLAATLVLWGCETPQQESVEEGVDQPVGDLLRTAAMSSQSSFNYPAAVSYYQNLYSRDSEDMDALLGLARNLRYIGAAAQAVTMLRKAIRDHPELIALRVELGKALVASGEAVEAVATLTETSEAAPDDWEVLSALGIAYDLLGDTEKARERYQAALAVSPDNLSVINNLALSMALSGQIDEGIALLERVSMRPKATPHIRQNLALMYAMKGDVETAQHLAEQDLPAEMVRHNVEYYERLYPRLFAAPGPSSEADDITPAPVAAIEVERLKAPVAEPVEPAVGEAPGEALTVVAAASAAAPPGDGQGGDTAQTPIDGIKVQLGVFPTREGATAGLTKLRDSHVDLLSGLRFEIAGVDGDDSSEGFMVLAGPLASEAMAADLCTKLHSRKEICRLVAP